MSIPKTSSNYYTRHNKIQLIHGGTVYFDFLEELIDSAVHSIHLQIYIIDDDSTGIRIGNALKRAAKRGVSVYLIADGYASQRLGRAFISDIKQSGVNFRYFEPLLRSTKFYFGRRLHQKTVVVDGIKGLVGGINIADRYNDIDDIPAWLDYAVYIEGEAVAQLYKISCDYWNLKTENKEQLTTESKLFLAEHSDDCSVRVRINDWVKGKNDIWRTYFSLFNKADKSITVMCSYFLPGVVLRKSLSKAAKRGVKVKVILAGPSDVMLAKYAERYLYQWMLKHGIEIYEYQPTVLHAKMTVVDEHWVTIGSFNVNNISAYASIELNLDIRNRPFATLVHNEFEDIIEKDCIQITERNIAPNATFIKRFIQKVSYEIIRIVLNLSTFYFKRE